MLKFLQLARAPFLTAVIAPMIWATVLAYHINGTFDWIRFALTLLGLMSAHAGANLLNDYYDFRLGADQDNPHRTPFSGGSPHIVEGRESPRLFLTWGILCFLSALICLVALAVIVDKGIGLILAMALVGFLGGVFYTAPPLKLAYRGLGEICIFVCFGVLPVVGTYYVQSQRLTAVVAAASLPLAFLITNIIWINQFPDYEADKGAGKRNLVVRLGLRHAVAVYHVLVSAAFVSVIILAQTSVLGRTLYSGLVGLPFSLAAAVILHRHYGEPKRIIPAQGLTIIAHLVTGMALTIALLFA